MSEDLGSSRERPPRAGGPPVREGSAPTSLFLFRLIPPRADFAQTMTAEERQAMAEHMEYWQQLLHDGRVVVYGPVADPEGVWGMGVLRAADRAEVLAIGERDPSVTAGVNTFEVFEIMGGITP
jgi:uncharacterized protein YciI